MKPWTDTKVEDFIGNLLRAGVVLSAAVVIIGGAIYLVHQGHKPANYRVFQSEPSELRGVSGIIQQCRLMSGRGIIQLGLLILIATPIARVAFSVFGFLAEKDRMYAGFTMFVLAILLYSLLGPS